MSITFKPVEKDDVLKLILDKKDMFIDLFIKYINNKIKLEDLLENDIKSLVLETASGPTNFDTIRRNIITLIETNLTYSNKFKFENEDHVDKFYRKSKSMFGGKNIDLKKYGFYSFNISQNLKYLFILLILDQILNLKFTNHFFIVTNNESSSFNNPSEIRFYFEKNKKNKVDDFFVKFLNSFDSSLSALYARIPALVPTTNRLNQYVIDNNCPIYSISPTYKYMSCIFDKYVDVKSPKINLIYPNANIKFEIESKHITNKDNGYLMHRMLIIISLITRTIAVYAKNNNFNIFDNVNATKSYLETNWNAIFDKNNEIFKNNYNYLCQVFSIDNSDFSRNKNYSKSKDPYNAILTGVASSSPPTGTPPPRGPRFGTLSKQIKNEFILNALAKALGDYAGIFELTFDENSKEFIIRINKYFDNSTKILSLKRSEHTNKYAGSKPDYIYDFFELINNPKNKYVYDDASEFRDELNLSLDQLNFGYYIKKNKTLVKHLPTVNNEIRIPINSNFIRDVPNIHAFFIDLHFLELPPKQRIRLFTVNYNDDNDNSIRKLKYDFEVDPGHYFFSDIFDHIYHILGIDSDKPIKQEFERRNKKYLYAWVVFKHEEDYAYCRILSRYPHAQANLPVYNEIEAHDPETDEVHKFDLRVLFRTRPDILSVPKLIHRGEPSFVDELLYPQTRNLLADVEKGFILALGVANPIDAKSKREAEKMDPNELYWKWNQFDAKKIIENTIVLKGKVIDVTDLSPNECPNAKGIDGAKVEVYIVKSISGNNIKLEKTPIISTEDTPNGEFEIRVSRARLEGKQFVIKATAKCYEHTSQPYDINPRGIKDGYHLDNPCGQPKHTLEIEDSTKEIEGIKIPLVKDAKTRNKYPLVTLTNGKKKKQGHFSGNKEKRNDYEFQTTFSGTHILDYKPEHVYIAMFVYDVTDNKYINLDVKDYNWIANINNAPVYNDLSFTKVINQHKLELNKLGNNLHYHTNKQRSDKDKDKDENLLRKYFELPVNKNKKFYVIALLIDAERYDANSPQINTDLPFVLKNINGNDNAFETHAKANPDKVVIYDFDALVIDYDDLSKKTISPLHAIDKYEHALDKLEKLAPPFHWTKPRTYTPLMKPLKPNNKNKIPIEEYIKLKIKKLNDLGKLDNNINKSQHIFFEILALIKKYYPNGRSIKSGFKLLANKIKTNYGTKDIYVITKDLKSYESIKGNKLGLHHIYRFIKYVHNIKI